MTPTLIHKGTFNRFVDGREVPTEVTTAWFDRESPARAYAQAQQGTVRIFREPRSALGLWRVVNWEIIS